MNADEIKAEVRSALLYFREILEESLVYQQTPRGGQHTNGGPPKFSRLTPSDRAEIQWHLRRIDEIVK